MDTSTRLRIATRIHFALLRHYGEKRRGRQPCMKAEGDARDAHVGLRRLRRRRTGRAWRASCGRPATPSRGRAAAVAAAAVPQDTAWSRNTSGFGVSRPIELEARPAAPVPSWLQPVHAGCAAARLRSSC